MSDLRLVPTRPDIAEAAYDCLRDLPAENGFENGFFGHTWEQFKQMDVPQMMNSAAGIGLRPEHVPQTYYFLMDGDKAVAMFKVRHRLNDFLREGAGHIGYGVRQSERGRGYATAGLALAVEALRPIIDTDEVYMSVNKNNPASLRVMLKNGAYIHHENVDHYFTRLKL